MSLKERLQRWFRPLPEPTEHAAAPVSNPVDEIVPAAPETMPGVRWSTSSTAQSVSDPLPAPEPLPDWLEDESLLRDEGVLFGLSDSRPEGKIAMIRTYFGRQTAQLEREVDQYNERIGELNLFIEQRENRIQEVAHKLAQLENRQPEGEHQLPRTLVGLAASVAMCAGNYFLIEETLRPIFQESRPIAIGVFLAGMFSLYGRTSAFFDHQAPMNGRRLVEEAGLPFAASLFIFIQALSYQSTARAVGLFVFVFFLFLLAGKLLLGTFTLLRNDLRFRAQNRKLAEEKQSRLGQWETEIIQLGREIDALRVQKWQVVPALNRADAELHRIIARRDSLIHLFESEYTLARSLRDRLSESQRRIIQGE